ILAANLIAWVTNSPTVTVTFNSNVMPFTEKNNVLLVVFLGGWTKYALQNSYSKDEAKGSVAGLKSVIKFYQGNNKSLTKDEQMEKLIELDTNNKLEAWVTEQLSKK